MKNLNEIKRKFKEIKKMGFVKSTRPNNKDGGIGNTLEDLLGISENNHKLADYKNFEIKSQRDLTSSLLSLFSKSPNHPQRANTFLRLNYGEVRDINFPNSQKFYATLSTNRDSLIYEKYKIKVYLDKIEKKVGLKIYNLNDELLNDTINWDFVPLEKASKKLTKVIYVNAKIKNINNETHFHFNNAIIFENFSFDKFINLIKKGKIFIDFRIGVYNSGKKIGKTHDHGTGFRINPKDLSKLYEKKITLK